MCVAGSGSVPAFIIPIYSSIVLFPEIGIRTESLINEKFFRYVHFATVKWLNTKVNQFCT